MVLYEFFMKGSVFVVLLVSLWTLFYIHYCVCFLTHLYRISCRPYIFGVGFLVSTVCASFILQHNVNAFTTMFLYLYNTRYTMSISFQSTYCFPCGTNYIFLDDGQISYRQRFSITTRSYKITVILTETNVRAAAGLSSSSAQHHSLWHMPQFFERRVHL